MIVTRSCNTCGVEYHPDIRNLRLGRTLNCSRECGYKVVAKKLTGSNNGMWNNQVGYLALHDWVRRHKDKSALCENCKVSKPYELANISQEYKRDVDDFK